MMKKIGLIFAALIFFLVHFGQTPVFAQMPVCSTAEVDLYATPGFNNGWTATIPQCVPAGATRADIESWPTGLLPRPCNPGESACAVGQKYCQSPIGVSAGVGGVGNAGCFKEGVTTQDPPCPPNTSPLSDFDGACKGNAEAKKYCAGTFFEITRSCTDLINRLRPNLVSRTKFCGSLFKYDDETGLCKGQGATAWEIVSKCDESDTVGIQTAIGCVPTGKLDLTLGFILKFALGAAGGVIILMLIVTGYGLLTSQGNPEKLAAARENVVSIFSGLILIVFSLVLLQTIGAGILGLPTF